MRKKFIAGLVLIIYFFSMVLNLYPVYAADGDGVNPNNYVIFPDKITVTDGIGTGTISLADEVSGYSIAYQKVELGETEYDILQSTKQSIGDHTEWIENNVLSGLTGEWTEIENTTNNLQLDFGSYSGTIYYNLIVKITDGTNTYYNMNEYTNTLEATEQTETITISDETLTLKVDETKQLTATSSTNSEITWESSDNEIATVSEDGLVTAIKEGTVVITAKGSEGTATCTITVEPKETTEGEWTDFSNAKFELKKGDNSQAFIEISNATPKEGSLYWLFVTSNGDEPNVTSDSEDGIVLRYDSETKKFISEDVSKYVELNQDLYVTIIERKSIDSEDVVIYGIKLDLADFEDTESDNPTKEPDTETDDPTKAPDILPDTGVGKYIMIISVLAVIVTISYIQFKKLKGIK